MVEDYGCGKYPRSTSWGDRQKGFARVLWTGKKVNLLGDLRRFWADESGPDLIEWVVVTVILTLAMYAILQALGPEIEQLLETLGVR